MKEEARGDHKKDHACESEKQEEGWTYPGMVTEHE